MNPTLEIVKERLAIKDSLHEQVGRILTLASPDDVMEEMIRRDEFRAENSKLINALREQEMELEKMCRKLREANVDTANDNKRLENYKFSLLYERKHRNL